MSAAWCGIRRACISYIRIDVFLANVNNSHWDVTQLFRLLARLMRRIAPLRNEILTCSRQSTLLAISLMKDYLFIAHNCVSRRRHLQAYFSSWSVNALSVVGLHPIRNDGCERTVCQKYLICARHGMTASASELYSFQIPCFTSLYCRH